MYKTFRIFFVVWLCSFIHACSNNASKPKSTSDDLYQFLKIDLSPYDLPATIHIPDETAGIGASFKTKIEHEEDFKWKISAGPNFELYIEDWGENQGRWQEFKSQLLASQVFKCTIIEENDHMIMYSKKLSQTNNAENYEHLSYHVYALIPINGVFYEITNRQEGDPLETTKLMFTSIKSFKPCPTK
jgi:hypothetical protein